MGFGLGATDLRDPVVLRVPVEMRGDRLVRLQIALRVPGGMTGVRPGRAGIDHLAGLGIDRRGPVGMIVRADLSRVGTGRGMGTVLREVVRHEVVRHEVVRRGAVPRVVVRDRGGLRAESLRVLFGSGRSEPCRMENSGCGAAWLARLLGVQEVPGSNPGSPTKFLKDLQPGRTSRC
jgi:hypothetical protein